MFQGLRQNSLFYILEKGERPTLQVGQVVSVSNPQPRFGQYQPGQMYGQNTETVVDVQVKVGDEPPFNFEKLPAVQSIANSDKWVVSDSREAMLSEVEALLANSRRIIDSVDYHQGVIEACDGIVEQLNPKIAQEREQERKIDALEKRMEKMDSSMYDIKSLLESINRNVSKNSKNQ